MIIVCLKWVTHPGEPHDERFAGISPADQSALEFALVQGHAGGAEVTAVTVGPVAASKVLRNALACGAARAVHLVTDENPTSEAVAAAVADAFPDAQWVWCGDYSLDRGSGSVPAFLAARLGARQALGVIALERSHDDSATSFVATRRLDGGRREVLLVDAPAVISVEGATAHLRRAGLAALRASSEAPLDTRQFVGHHRADDAVISPYRPRARALPAPVGNHPLERLRALTDAADSLTRSDTVVLDPAEAAARIVGALEDWGYLT